MTRKMSIVDGQTRPPPPSPTESSEVIRDLPINAVVPHGSGPTSGTSEKNQHLGAIPDVMKCKRRRPRQAPLHGALQAAHWGPRLQHRRLL